MREFFEIINEYPWTTFFVWIMILPVIALLTELKKNKS